jgi:hypothetical protein
MFMRNDKIKLSVVSVESLGMFRKAVVNVGNGLERNVRL